VQGEMFFERLRAHLIDLDTRESTEEN